MSGNCYYCGGHPDEVVDLRRRRDELEAEIERLRELVADYERVVGKIEPGTDKIAFTQGIIEK